MPMKSSTRTQCVGTSRRTGEQCGAFAIPGGTVCQWHGGRAPQVKAAAARRLAIAEAREQAARWGGRVDIDPAQALLELVSAKAAEVAYWERRIDELNEDDLTWGVTKIEDGIDRDQTTHIETREARKDLALDLLHVAQRDLANFAAAALRAGVDQALVKVAQSQAVQIVEILRAALNDDRVTITGEPEVVILDALHRKGLTA